MHRDIVWAICLEDVKKNEPTTLRRNTIYSTRKILPSYRERVHHKRLIGFTRTAGLSTIYRGKNHLPEHTASTSTVRSSANN
jgi:hypothetical protein